MQDQTLPQHPETCPAWCVQTGSPHGIHQSTPLVLCRGRARWNISLGQVLEADPHLTVVYLGEVAPADAHWQLPLGAAVTDYASFAARLGEAQVASAITAMAARVGEQVPA